MINSPLVKGVLITQILYDLTKYLRYLSHEAPEVERNTEVDQTNRYDFSQEELWAKEGVSLPLYLEQLLRCAFGCADVCGQVTPLSPSPLVV
jgi:hypothetical protein